MVGDRRTENVGAEPSLAEQRQRLVTLREEYLQRLRKISADVAERLPQDSEERAVVLENRDVIDALEQEAKHEVAMIDAALARLDAGDYGKCVACGEAIPPARLSAYPAATRCTQCQRAT